MRAVLYTDDMLPITVLELGPVHMEFLSKNRSLVIPVHRPITYESIHDEPTHVDFYRVEIFAESFIRKNVRHMLLITHDEELALLLNPAFLPGQIGEVQRKEREARYWGAADTLILVKQILSK